MSLVQKAVRGAAWTTMTGILARAASLVTTMAVTHRIDPDQYGRANAAVIVVLTADALATFFLSNYLIIEKTSGRAAAWHAHAIHQVAGFIAFAAIFPLAPWITKSIGQPNLIEYIPYAVVAFLLARFSLTPEKILVRELRFRYIAVTRMIAELVYSAVVFGGAVAGWGGIALLAGAIARTGVRSFGVCIAVPWREWTLPQRFDPVLTKKMFGFGLPLWLSGTFGYISGNWDNLLVSRYFGPSVMGAYGLAFNLADVPAAQIGEQMSEVLLPSFALLDRELRRQALVKATLVVCLVTFPIVVGLGAISGTMGEAFFNQRWALVAPLLFVLTMRSLGRTYYYPLTQYLQSIDRNRFQMWLGIMHTTILIGTIVALGGRSPILTCFGVVFSITVLAIAGTIVVGREGVPVGKLAFGVLRILLACALMTLAILGLRHLIAPHVAHAVVRLLAEVAVGGVVFVGAALVLCQAPARDLLSWGRRGLRRGEPAAT